MLPIAVTRIRYHAGEEVGEQEEHDSRRRQGTACWGAATWTHKQRPVGRVGRAERRGRTGARACCSSPGTSLVFGRRPHKALPPHHTVHGGTSCDEAQHAHHWQWPVARRGGVHRCTDYRIGTSTAPGNCGQRWSAHGRHRSVNCCQWSEAHRKATTATRESAYEDCGDDCDRGRGTPRGHLQRQLARVRDRKKPVILRAPARYMFVERFLKVIAMSLHRRPLSREESRETHNAPCSLNLPPPPQR